MHSRRNIIAVILNITFIAWTLAASYGKFDAIIGDTRACKGPRQKDCGHLTQNVIPTNAGRMQAIYVEVFENTSIDVIRMLAYKTGSGKNAPAIINLKLNNPCSQTILVGLFKNMSFPTEKACLVKKGKYNYTVDARSVGQKLWGGSFFYGNFTFKTTFYGPKCNLLCNTTNVTFSPIIQG